MITAESPHQDQSWLLTRRLVVAVALLQLVYQCGLLLKGFDFIVARLPIDDAYYYLQVAWNTPRLGFVTFDGVHRTNGMQFLWSVILIVLSPFSGSRPAFLIECLVLCLCLNALCYYPLYRIGKATGRPLFTIVLALAWFNINLTHVNWYLSGMENSLHSLVIWLLAAQMICGGGGEKAGAVIRLCVLLVLNVWCRVDAALLSAVLYGTFVWKERRVLSAKILLISAVVSLAGAGIMLAGFFAMGGYPLPVSGLIKAHGHRWSFTQLPLLFSRGFEFVAPVRFLFPDSVPLLFRTVWAPLIFGVLVLWASAASTRRPRTWPSSLRWTWCGLALGTMGQLAYLSGLGVYAQYGIWYQSGFFIFCALSLAIACEELVGWLKGRLHFGSRQLAGLAVAAGLVYGAFAGGWLFRRAIERPHPESFSYTRYRLARWIQQNTSPNDVLAAFNAGEIAYFSERRVINLDGLVNDYRYYREVILGGASLADYLADNGVGYLVDYQMPVDVPSGATILHTLPDEEGNVFRVLKLPSPERAP